MGFAAFACIFIAVGSGLAWSQASKLNSWLPVAATITASSVEMRHGSKGGKNHAPVVTFAYQIDGREHSASTPLPLDTAGSSGWAYGIALRFKPGQSVTAYYNPREPEQAFLLREVSAFPYLFILFPMIHVCAGLAIWWFGGSPGLDARGKARRMGWMVVLWDAVGVLAFVHYLSIGGTFELMAGLAFGIYAAVAVVPVLIWTRFLRKAALAGAETVRPEATPPTTAAPSAPPGNLDEPENPFGRRD